MTSRSRNNTIAAKVSDDELSALLKLMADQEEAGHRRVTKSSLVADLVVEGLKAKGYLGPDGGPPPCAHPKARHEKFSWGKKCGVCGTVLTGAEAV